jgi:hypothetical protein
MGTIRIYHLSQVPDMESLLAMLKDVKLMNKQEAETAPEPAAAPEAKPAPKPEPAKVEEVAPPPFDVGDGEDSKKA